ncbi:hypothetical protein [Kitasatospora sp. NPDC085879]|uniref:hypothetical protein n=1 Tax=Kitasatospora sp. NPDC085879 TaxID=3154769 RepID=UPI0034216283
MLDDPVACESELLLSTAAQHLAAVTLTSLPHTARTDLLPADTRDATPATLRRAMAFIDDNAHWTSPWPTSSRRPTSRRGPCATRSGGSPAAPRWPTCDASGWPGRTAT